MTEACLQRGVVTKDGYLFDREAILDYYLEQKKQRKERLKEWEAEQARDGRQVSRSSGHCTGLCPIN